MQWTREPTHLDKKELPRMMHVSDKAETLREAVAQAVLWGGCEVMSVIRGGRTPKGNVIETARIV